MGEQISRRLFLAAVGAGAISWSNSVSAHESGSAMIPYEGRLADRLWMWGHGAGSTDTLYGIPTGHGIDEADAIRSMGITNLCVIRWLNLPKPENEGDPSKPPFANFCKTLTDVKRVAWSVVDGGTQSYEQKKAWAFDLAEKLPNLTTFFFDDFFIGTPTLEGGRTEPEAHLTVAQLKEFRVEMSAHLRRPELAAVLYSNQINEHIVPHLNEFDVVSFWTWHATDLAALESNFRRYREFLPNKRTLLGIYMWDFGNQCPVTSEMMTHQLDFALEKYKRGEIEGMIFHCTPLCDIGLEAVEQSRQWIAVHAND